jgi:hypothetical protein
MEIVNHDIPNVPPYHCMRYAGRPLAHFANPFHEVDSALGVTHAFCLLDVVGARAKSVQLIAIEEAISVTFAGREH